MRNKFLKIAGVAVLGVILLCVLLGVFQRPVNRGIWLMENVEALTSGEIIVSGQKCSLRKGDQWCAKRKAYKKWVANYCIDIECD